MKTKNSIALSLILLAVMVCIPAAHASLDTTTAISVSLLNQDPDPAVTGDIFEVRFGVENLGGQAANGVSVALSPTYPFQLVPGDSAVQEIGTMNAYQGGQSMKILKYRVMVDKNAVAGSYNLNLNYYSDGASAKKSMPVEVKSRESAVIIRIDRVVLVPGKQSILTFKINDVGNTPLSDLTFRWENTDKIILPVGSDNTRYVNYIDVGDTANVEFQVIADSNAQAGLYPLNLYLTYGQSGNSTPKTISTVAGMYVGGETDFDVALSDSSSGATSFSIANVGSNPATSVSVIIPEQNGWKVSGSNSYMVGNLNKGDYTVASFQMQSPFSNTTSSGANFAGRNGRAFNNSVPLNGTQGALQIQIAYTDTMGERHIIDKEIRLNAQSLQGSTSRAAIQAGAQSTSTSYGNYVVIIVVLAAGYWLYRRYGTKKKNYSGNYSQDNSAKRKKDE